MTASAFSPDTAIDQLKQVRMGLLRLHKALLDAEKITYEQEYGRVKTNMEFFGLVLNNEWFQWLRPMSGLIAEIDEAVGNKKSPITADVAVGYLEQVNHLVTVNPTGDGSALKYYEAIERDPDVAHLHVTVARILQGAAN